MRFNTALDFTLSSKMTSNCQFKRCTSWTIILLLAVGSFGGCIRQISAASIPQGFTEPPFIAEVWAQNLTGVRGMVVDSAGDVLVVTKGSGIYALWEESNGVVNRTLVVNNSALNHGITLYQNHVYASSANNVWRWNYVAGQRNLSRGSAETIVSNISNNAQGVDISTGHQTRSLAIDRNGTLYVSVGSTSNVDPDPFRARIRSFRLASLPKNGFDFVSQGRVFADGVRNEVGLTFDSRGRLWGVENGADELSRNDIGGDIHNDNPAEELNLFNAPAGTFYGYPYCWSEYYLKDGDGQGSQWVWPIFENNTMTDSWCKNASNVRRPVLAMQAHMAPLGITFFNGTNCGNRISKNSSSYALACDYIGDAFVAFHGSWNRDVPVGFKVSRIHFDNKTWLPAANNDSSAMFDIFGQQKSATECAGDDAESCLRPVDVKIDKYGTLLVTSDTTGEIIRVSQNTSSGTTPAPAPPPPKSTAVPLTLPDFTILFFTTFVSLFFCHSA